MAQCHANEPAPQRLGGKTLGYEAFRPFFRLSAYEIDSRRQYSGGGVIARKFRVGSMFTLASAGRIDTRDIAEHRQVVQPWELILRQMSPGPFRGRIEYVRVNGILFYRERCTRRVVATGTTPPGYFVFGSPSSQSAPIDWCGGKIHPGRLAFGRSSSEIDAVIPAGSDHVALLVPEVLLLGYLGEELGSRVAASDAYHLRCGAALGDELVRMIQRLIDQFPAGGELPANDGWCKAVEWELLGMLVQAFQDGGVDAGRVSPRRRRLAFLRAIEYGADLRLPLSVPQLAAATGVHQRVLELAFHEALDITPRKYLRWNRMNHARQELIAVQAGSAPVKGVAADCGFAEPGRFAVEYKHLFGESPSNTLARTAPPPPVRLADALGKQAAL